jgi:hypothetical protein
MASLDRAPAARPAARMSSALSVAQLRYKDFKLRQIEGLGTVRAQATMTAPSAAQLRFVDFKLRQIGSYV